MLFKKLDRNQYFIITDTVNYALRDHSKISQKINGAAWLI